MKYSLFSLAVLLCCWSCKEYPRKEKEGIFISYKEFDAIKAYAELLDRHGESNELLNSYLEDSFHIDVEEIERSLEEDKEFYMDDDFLKNLKEPNFYELKSQDTWKERDFRKRMTYSDSHRGLSFCISVWGNYRDDSLNVGAKYRRIVGKRDSVVNGIVGRSYIWEFDSSTVKIDQELLRSIDFELDNIRFWDLDGSNAQGPSGGVSGDNRISIEAIYAWGDLTSYKRVNYSSFHHSHVLGVCKEFVKLTDPKLGLYEVIGIEP